MRAGIKSQICDETILKEVRGILIVEGHVRGSFLEIAIISTMEEGDIVNISSEDSEALVRVGTYKYYEVVEIYSTW